MNKRFREFALILIGLIILGMLVPTVVFASDLPVLLVWDSSDFKDELVQEIQEAAAEAGVQIDTEDSMKFLKDIDPTLYSGIIIVNTGMAGHMKGKVRDLIEESAELPPTVVVTTFGNPSKSNDPENPHPSVDAITTASLSDAGEIRDLARELVRSLQSR